MRIFKTFVLPVASLCMMLPGYAETMAPGGVIHFRGAIVEGGCDYKTQTQQLVLTCPEGRKTKTQQLPFHDISGQSFASLAKIEMHYLNPQHTKANIVISYN